MGEEVAAVPCMHACAAVALEGVLLQPKSNGTTADHDRRWR